MDPTTVTEEVTVEHRLGETTIHVETQTELACSTFHRGKGLKTQRKGSPTCVVSGPPLETTRRLSVLRPGSQQRSPAKIAKTGPRWTVHCVAAGALRCHRPTSSSSATPFLEARVQRSPSEASHPQDGLGPGQRTCSRWTELPPARHRGGRRCTRRRSSHSGPAAVAARPPTPPRRPHEHRIVRTSWP